MNIEYQPSKAGSRLVKAGSFLAGAGLLAACGGRMTASQATLHACTKPDKVTPGSYEFNDNIDANPLVSAGLSVKTAQDNAKLLLERVQSVNGKIDLPDTWNTELLANIIR